MDRTHQHPAAVKRFCSDPGNYSSLGVASAKWAKSPCFYKAAPADVSPAEEPGLLFVLATNVLQGREIKGDCLLQLFEIKKPTPAHTFLTDEVKRNQQ